jgi:type I restriction enzyme, S subunit
VSAGIQLVRLADVALLNPRLTEDLLAETLVSFVPMSAVSAETARVEVTTDRAYSEVSKGYTSFQSGDVLFAKITPCFENGKIAQAVLPRQHGFGSTEFHVIRPRKDKSDARYLHHFLRQERVRVAGEKRMTGSGGQRRVPTNFLSELEVHLPPLPEQRRIAAILDQAETLRTQRRTALALLDTLTQSIFLDMFGDPLTNPKAWPVSTVGTLAAVQGGLQVTTARKDLPLVAPYLRVANVYRKYLDLSEIKTIRATATEIARTTLLKDDLLIVEGHGNPNEIGRSALWTGEIEGCIHQNHIIRARLDAQKVVPIYACEYLNSQGGRQHLMRTGKTTTGLNTISVSNVRETPIALPPLPLQQTFATRIQAIEALKSTHRAALAQLDALFASLQHRAFSGTL